MSDYLLSLSYYVVIIASWHILSQYIFPLRGLPRSGNVLTLLVLIAFCAVSYVGVFVPLADVVSVCSAIACINWLHVAPFPWTGVSLWQALVIWVHATSVGVYHYVVSCNGVGGITQILCVSVVAGGGICCVAFKSSFASGVLYSAVLLIIVAESMHIYHVLLFLLGMVYLSSGIIKCSSLFVREMPPYVTFRFLLSINRVMRGLFGIKVVAGLPTSMHGLRKEASTAHERFLRPYDLKWITYCISGLIIGSEVVIGSVMLLGEGHVCVLALYSAVTMHMLLLITGMGPQMLHFIFARLCLTVMLVSQDSTNIVPRKQSIFLLSCYAVVLICCMFSRWIPSYFCYGYHSTDNGAVFALLDRNFAHRVGLAQKHARFIEELHMVAGLLYGSKRSSVRIENVVVHSTEINPNEYFLVRITGPELPLKDALRAMYMCRPIIDIAVTTERHLLRDLTSAVKQSCRRLGCPLSNSEVEESIKGTVHLSRSFPWELRREALVMLFNGSSGDGQWCVRSQTTHFVTALGTSNKIKLLLHDLKWSRGSRNKCNCT